MPDQITPEERLAEVTRILANGARLLLAKRRDAEAGEQSETDQPPKAAANSRS